MTTINFSPFNAIFVNKSAGTVITGMPGAGKTFFQLTLMSNALVMGQKIAAIDNKNDLAILAEIFPEVDIVDINNIKSGALNIFNCLEDVSAMTILSLVDVICGGLTESEKTEITPSIRDFYIGYNRYHEAPSMTDLADNLYRMENQYCRNIGNRLLLASETSYGPLIFGKGNKERSLSFNADSKIISLHGLDLPAYGAKPTEIQQFNSSIVFIICLMLREMLKKNKYPTLFEMDECHIAFKIDAFKNIIDEILVLGRSLGIATVLGTQSVEHFPEGISQLISSKFCFRSSSRDASKFLDTFMDFNNQGIEDQEIVNRIVNFNNGDCMYIDQENRVGMIHIKSPFEELITSNPLYKKNR